MKLSKILLVLFVITLGGGAGLWINNVITKATEHSANYKESVKEALEELKLGSRISENESVDLLSSFTQSRSGIKLDSEVAELLIQKERKFRLRRETGISSVKLGELISDAILERISKFNEKEIESAVESWRGFYHHDLPDSYKNGRNIIRLRADGTGGSIRPEELTRYLTEFTRNYPSGFSKHQEIARSQIVAETARKLNILSETMPNRFLKQDKMIAPADIFLIAYLVISDDNLNGSTQTLRSKMQNLENWAADKYGKYPKSSGFLPFGENGYLYSSPVNLLFDSEGQKILLQKMKSEEENSNE